MLAVEFNALPDGLGVVRIDATLFRHDRPAVVGDPDVGNAVRADDLLQQQLQRVVIVGDDVIGERLGDKVAGRDTALVDFLKRGALLAAVGQPGADGQRDEQGGNQDQHYWHRDSACRILVHPTKVPDLMTAFDRPPFCVISM